ncbi:MAG: DUF2169 domain-containing protein [Byssovorax sp.]
MQLRNATSYPAELLRGVSPRGDDRMLGCVIVRRTYRLRHGELVETPDEPWPIGAEGAETPLGPMPGDKGVYPGGIDVLVGGTVRQPDGSLRPRLDVEIEVGRRFRRRIAVFGDRTWIPAQDGRLIPSDPEPFLSMDLRYERAFGGQAPTDYGVSMPFSQNPIGKGFYLGKETAAGRPLPNLEDPSRLITSIDDHPDPVGLGYYPLDGSLRPLASLDHPIAKAMADRTLSPASAAGAEPLRPEQIKPTLFSMAHPAMIIEAGKGPEPGDRIRLSHGMRDGDLEFLMPSIPLHVHVQLESRHYLFPLHLDQVGLVGGEGRVMFSHRCVFEYRLVKRERRIATLHTGPLPEAMPEGYPVALASAWDD